MSGHIWATEQEAMKHARVSASTLRRWRAQGLLTGYKIGRTVRYDLAEIDQMIAGGGQPTCHADLAPQQYCAECGTYNTQPEEEQRSAAHQDA